MPGLYAILDPAQCRGRNPRTIAEAILRGGCARLQLRSKELADRELVPLARDLAHLARAHHVPFIVNDRPDIAVLADADGLHLGQDDLPITEARRFAPTLEIGVSTHSLAQAIRAAEEGASVIGFGPVFATTTKDNPDPVVGLERLREVVRAAGIPVVAIGGIDLTRIADIAESGATYAACISALCAADDPESAARTIHARFLGTR